ncbi:CBU_0592 family membrane protein [Jannaschia sp. M317]|uniref:CBU_0592 family membrane protein n=1 Tax=Jannaschia sp. M317 TaxID=2867011 RepID=UPI0021A5C5DF|nr:hypothetical protein [Jannaschia sp. M317]UWQ18777.1 hypothetical protein K3551_05680 [Jannaschia sp. M317]
MSEITVVGLPLLQIAGIIGALTYVANYISLTLRLLNPEGVGYFLFNLTAASLVLLSLGHAFNLASLIIQMFFIAVSLWGICSRLRRRRRGHEVPAPTAFRTSERRAKGHPRDTRATVAGDAPDLAVAAR